MTEILITAATEDEIAPLVEHLALNWIAGPSHVFTSGQISVEIMITGIGMVRTAYSLGFRLAGRKPTLCINCGIAGAFPGKFAIGDVVNVTRDCFSEIGAQSDDGSLLSVEEMGLSEDINSRRLENTDANEFNFLPTATGITVNTVHGEKAAIHDVIQHYDPDIETMESAAVFYVCLKTATPFLVIRGISNIVEPRDRSKWDIPTAITNLNQQLIEMLSLLKG